MKWIPNTLSISRIILSPFVMLTALKHNWALALSLLVISCLTDFFDGIAAKKFNAQTDFGKKILDPICDAFLAAGAVAGLVFQNHVLHNLLAWGFPILILGLILKALKHQHKFPKLQRFAIPILPACEFIVIIVLLLIYANHAFPSKIIFFWILTIIGLPVALYIKRNRIDDWLSGRL